MNRQVRGATAILPEEAEAIAEEAYVYGYPLVLMDVTRRVCTAVPYPTDHKAPENQFAHLRVFPGPWHKEVVSPHADTLYSVAWLDLSRQPIILSVPATSRYYLLPILSGWTDVFSVIGSRTTGNDEGHFAIAGPAWDHQPLPAGVNKVISPTEMAWIVGRTQADAIEDLSAVHIVQNEFRLTPLDAWGKPYRPVRNLPPSTDIDVKSPPADQVAAMDAAAFLGRLAKLMQNNPPTKADYPLIMRFSRIGLFPGEEFNADLLPVPIAAAIARAAPAALRRIARAHDTSNMRTVNGWSLNTSVGRYGTNYLDRAFTAMIGLGANLPEDAIYQRAEKDQHGEPLLGTNRYVIHLHKGQMPPVNAFWSMTLYDTKQFLTDNGINRYSIGSRDKLRFNPDSSLDIYIQNEWPGASVDSNWLPAPNKAFNLVFRLCWPKPVALDRGWWPPQITRID